MVDVLLFTNTVAPYRLPLFQQLAREINLHVLFARERTADRRWRVSPAEYTFRFTLLPHRRVRLGGAVQILHPDLLARLRRIDFDVAILGDNRQTALSGLVLWIVARARRRPLIVWTGITPGEDQFARSGRGLRGLYARYRHGLLRRAAAVVAYGTATREYLIRLDVPAERIFTGTQVVPQALLPSPATDRRALGVEGRTVVLTVGYMVPRKGMDLLIRAFRQVAGPDDLLVLVGSGPEEETLRQLAAGDDRIWFPGYLEGSRKTAWYAAADLFVLPTLHDPWGLVVNEAMVFSLPIITTDSAGCAPDLVRDNGLIVPAGDVDALADALGKLLFDEPLRRRMGLRSREIISSYTVEWACSTFVRAVHYVLGQ
ncbi:MAG TPA: glycosyltransferase family 4 protein [Thermoflexia bacterium]|jgi:glycosyltransferase involved in cell wall biosynthesis|nr:glycosyltransferase family 4 protein [Thermoflexia bacterium]